EHLGTEVAGRAGEAVPRGLLAHHLDGQAEVGELQVCTFVFARQQQILRLEVSVHDVVLVAVAHRVQYLLYAVRCVNLAVEFARYNVLEYFTARYSRFRKRKRKKINSSYTKKKNFNY